MIHACRSYITKGYGAFRTFVHWVCLAYHCSHLWKWLSWRSKVTTLSASPIDLWSGSAQQGYAILNGFFIVQDLNGYRYQQSWAGLDELFFRCDPYFVPYLYGFEWLRDLKGTGEMSARRLARRMIEYWSENELFKKDLSKIGASPIVGARRLSSWILLYDFFGASARDTFKSVFFKNVQNEYRILKRCFFKKMKPDEKIILIKTLLEYNVYIEYDESFFTLLLPEVRVLIQKIEALITASMLAPQAIYHTLCKVIEIRNVLTQWGKSFLYLDYKNQKMFVNVFENVQVALKRMMQCVRFYRHSNGELCGIRMIQDNRGLSENIRSNNIDVALSQVDSIGRISKTEDSGIVRFSEKHTVLFVNTNPQKAIEYRLQGYEKSMTPNVMNLEWSVESNILIHHSAFALYQKNRSPSFFRMRSEEGEGNQTALRYHQSDVLEGFRFEAIDEGCQGEKYAHRREIKTLVSKKSLLIHDSMIVDDAAGEPVVLMQFTLGENMKLLEMNYENGASSGSAIFGFESMGLQQNRRPRKRSKQKVCCSVHVLATDPVYLDVKNVRGKPILTLMCLLQPGITSDIDCSFLVQKI